MARTFNGTSQYIRVAAGTFNGVPFTFGTAAAIVRNSSSISDYQEIISFGTGPNVYIGREFGGNWNCSWNSGSTNSFGASSPVASEWYFVACTKTTGTATPRFHIYRYSTQTWAHENGNVTMPNGSSNLTSIDIGRYSTGFEYWGGDIAAVGAFRTWIPSDTDIEALGLHVDLSSWYAAAQRSDKAAIWLLDQSATTIPVWDRTGLGANESSGTLPTISANPVPLFSYGGSIISASAVVAAGATANLGTTSSTDTAYGLSGTRSTTTATSTDSAYGMGIGAQLLAASATAVANALSGTRTTVVATSVGTAYALQGTRSLFVATSTGTAYGQGVGLQTAVASALATASPLSLSFVGTIPVANSTGVANTIAMAESLPLASATGLAFALTAPGRSLAVASLATLAYNIGLADTVPTAAASGAAFAPTAALSVSAALGAGQALSLASTRSVPSTAPSSGQAFGLTQTRSTLLGLASASATAYNLSLLIASNVLMGPASATATAYNISLNIATSTTLGLASSTGVAYGIQSFVLASTGLATSTATAYPVNTGVGTNAVGSATGVANTLAMSRYLGDSALAAGNAYGIDINAALTIPTANVLGTSYNITIAIEAPDHPSVSPGPKPGIPSFKQGGRGRTGTGSNRSGILSIR